MLVLMLRCWLSKRIVLGHAMGRLDALSNRINALMPSQLATLRASLHKNAGALFQSQLAKLDLVPRTEFEASRRMLEHTRAKLDALEAQIAKHEASESKQRGE